MNEHAPPEKGEAALRHAATLPKPQLLVDHTPLICGAQTWGEHGDTRIEPHSVEAEQGVLGSMLQLHNGSEAIAEAMAKIGAEHFYVPAHRTIFTAICDLWDSGQAVDLITFTQSLRDKKLLDQVGGAAFVTNLFTFVPCAANVGYYIDIVRDMYVRRQIIENAANDARCAYDPNPNADIRSVLDEISSRAMSLRSLHGRNGTQISFRSPTEILAMPRNPKANFFGDRLLGIGRSLVLAGIGGIGKSRLLLQLLFAFILERAWCGIETHHTKGQPWMLVQTQNSTDRLQDDLEPLKKYAGSDWPLVEKNLLIHTLETDRDLMLHLSDPKNASELENAIRERNPIGVAFDPLNELGIGDLSKDVDMTATCDVIGRISRVGNPERAIVVLTHAITGLAGMKKAFGFEAAGFGRNSKVLQMWTRAQINIIPGTEDYSVLVLTCGKLNDGKMFSPFAVRFADTKIYQPEPDFDIEALREHVTAGKKKQKFDVEMVRNVKFSGELEIGPLAKLIGDKIGCGRARSYELVHEGHKKAKIFRYNKITETYAKI